MPPFSKFSLFSTMVGCEIKAKNSSIIKAQSYSTYITYAWECFHLDSNSFLSLRWFSKGLRLRKYIAEKINFIDAKFILFLQKSITCFVELLASPSTLFYSNALWWWWWDILLFIQKDMSYFESLSVCHAHKCCTYRHHKESRSKRIML